MNEKKDSENSDVRQALGKTRPLSYASQTKPSSSSSAFHSWNIRLPFFYLCQSRIRKEGSGRIFQEGSKNNRMGDLLPKARRFRIDIVLLSLILVNLAIQTQSFPIFQTRTSRRNKSHIINSQVEGGVDEATSEEAVALGRSELAKYFNFPLDDWQLQTGGEILMGHNVIVCAPTGSGKTVCGEMALHIAFDKDLDGIYTTPLKALSNQKFAE